VHGDFVLLGRFLALRGVKPYGEFEFPGYRGANPPVESQADFRDMRGWEGQVITLQDQALHNLPADPMERALLRWPGTPNPDQRPLRPQAISGWDDGEGPGEVNGPAFRQGVLQRSQPVSLPISSYRPHIGPEAVDLLEVADKGCLPQDADDDGVFLQRLAEDVNPQVVNLPPLAPVNCREIDSGDEERLGQSQAQQDDDTRFEVGLKHPGQFVQPDAYGHRKKQEGGKEENLHVGDPVKLGEGGERDESGRPQEGQAVACPCLSAHPCYAHKPQGQPYRSELLPPEAEVEGKRAWPRQRIRPQEDAIGAGRDPSDETAKGVLVSPIQGSGDQAPQRDVEVKEQGQNGGKSKGEQRESLIPLVKDDEAQEQSGCQQHRGSVMGQAQPEEESRLPKRRAVTFQCPSHKVHHSRHEESVQGVHLGYCGLRPENRREG